MRVSRHILAFVLMLGTSVGLADALRIQIETGAGAITVELYPDKAPVTVANFLKYLDGGFYDGGEFVRTVRADNQPNNPVKIGVIQAFGNPWLAATQADSQTPIPLERTRDTGLRHLDGTISMARGAPDTATTEFFICIGAQPELDFGGRRNPDGQGFAAFGRVVEGMDVVRQIQQQPAVEQALLRPVRILAIRRLEPPEQQAGRSP